MKTHELPELLDEVRDRLFRAIAYCDDTCMQFTDRDGRWSASQILHHLVLSERQFSGLLQHLMDGASGNAEENSTPPEEVPDSETLFAMESQMLSVPAGEGSEPESGYDADTLRRQLDEVRAATRRLLERALSCDCSGITYEFEGLGTFNIYQLFLFLAVHERAHGAQTDEVVRDARNARGQG